MAATFADTKCDGWSWWAGSSEEWMTIGPCCTKEAAIDEACQDGAFAFVDKDGNAMHEFHLVEARHDPLRLADWIGADDLLERADDQLADSDRTSAECDDGPWFEATQEQEGDLRERIKRACDDWQTAHGLTFSCSTFSAMRNAEFITVPDESEVLPNPPHDLASGEVR